mmetsp:Transcript_3687/g.10676  ORF Transcript_3687/g.10676 Transcript_3687/m.10676 type:complete len:852 (-) Transcript_3687:293-2848(-)
MGDHMAPLPRGKRGQAIQAIQATLPETPATKAPSKSANQARSTIRRAARAAQPAGIVALAGQAQQPRGRRSKKPPAALDDMSSPSAPVAAAAGRADDTSGASLKRKSPDAAPGGVSEANSGDGWLSRARGNQAEAAAERQQTGSAGSSGSGSGSVIRAPGRSPSPEIVCASGLMATQEWPTGPVEQPKLSYQRKRRVQWGLAGSSSGGCRTAVESDSGSGNGSGGILREGLLRQDGGVDIARQQPQGIENLGNTCYMNATLQVLMGLQPFIEDLKAASAVAADAACTLASASAASEFGERGSKASIIQALLDFFQRQQAASKYASRTPAQGASPEAIKRTIDQRMSTFQGAFQQDAHEFLGALLEEVQTEVVRREAALCGPKARSVPLLATACPAARNFSFCIERQVTCSKCGEVTCVAEQYRDLSLELPPDGPVSPWNMTGCTPGWGNGAPRLCARKLIQQHLQDEMVEKSCEKCGGGDVAHRVQHVLRRLPRVLVLHLKRFQVQLIAGSATSSFRKLHSRVAVPDSLDLSALTDSATSPPLERGRPSLPLPAQLDASGDKENCAAAGNHALQTSPYKQALAGPAPASLALLGVPGTRSNRGVLSEPATPPPLLLPLSPGGVPAQERPLQRAPPQQQSCAAQLSDGVEGPCKSGADVGACGLLECTGSAAQGLVDLAVGGDSTEEEQLQEALRMSREEAEFQQALLASVSPNAPAARIQSCSGEPAEGLYRHADGGSDVSATTPMSPPAPGAVSASGREPPEVYHVTEPVHEPSASQESVQAMYQLKAVINHVGHTCQSGHFTAHVRDPLSGRWFCHNDSHVLPLDPTSHTIQVDRPRDCYVLLYQHTGL